MSYILSKFQLSESQVSQVDLIKSNLVDFFKNDSDLNYLSSFLNLDINLINNTNSLLNNVLYLVVNENLLLDLGSTSILICPGSLFYIVDNYLYLIIGGMEFYSSLEDNDLYFRMLSEKVFMYDNMKGSLISI